MRYINGQILKMMLISAANNLYNHYPEIDALNVFPVPDGDTGMNMNLTLSSGSKEIQNRNDEDVYTIANLFSRGLLMGARGNSGVITSQIFRGFASSLKDKKVMKVNDFVEALKNGSKVAYKAVMRPVEGTILTVIRESSEALEKDVTSEMSMEKAMAFLIKEAKASLKRTPDLLPVLKEVGVVDSGGAGLLKIFEGMQAALQGSFIKKSVATSVDASISKVSVDSGYILSFVLKLGPKDKKKEFVELRFKNILSSKSDNLEIEHIDENTIKMKMHTLAPGQIFTYAQNFGEFSDISVVNVTENNNDASKETIKDEPKKEFALVAISSGSGLDEYFKEIGVDEIVSGGQTMNPSTEDIISAIKRTNAKTVFVLPNNSNIILSAMQTADVLADSINVVVIPTKTIPQGIVASSVFNSDADVDTNFEEMKNSYENLKSGSVTYAIKDTTVDGFKVTKDYFIGILDKKILSCEKDKIESLYKLLEQMIDEESYLVSLFAGEDISKEQMDEIKQYLVNKYPNVEFDIHKGNQPVYSFLIGVE